MSEPSDEEFLRMVRYFYETKGDPTRYVFWDEARFERLRPFTHKAWKEWMDAEDHCDRLMALLEQD